jgi:signal transduction histidine kinase
VHLEEQLQISDKMASVGLLAAGVAHEVNTPLTGISSFTQMLLEATPIRTTRRRACSRRSSSRRSAPPRSSTACSTCRARRASWRGERPVDLNAIISDVLSLLEPQCGGGKVKVRRELCPSSGAVSGIEHKLQQVFLNLFLNARDAMPQGRLAVGQHRLEDGQVVAEVGDTGSGIPSEHLARIYDPFFTHEGDRQGHRPGLSDHLRHRARARRHMTAERRRQGTGLRSACRSRSPRGRA